MKTTQPRLNHGFSLIEIAIVLVIISVLVSIVAIPLSTQLEQRRIEDTNKQLETIKEALIGYALANGRFPCAAGPTDNGRESLTTTAASGACNKYIGFVPAVTLGLSPIDSSGFAVDAWGLTQNRIGYAVSRVNVPAGTIPIPPSCTLPLDNVFTKTDGMRSATMSCLGDTSLPLSLNMLTVTTTTVTNVAAGCNPVNLTTKAPFVVFSLGKNAATGGTDPDEAQNKNNSATTFVSHTPTTAGSCAGEFDDLVTWPSLNTIFARMVQAGKLP